MYWYKDRTRGKKGTLKLEEIDIDKLWIYDCIKYVSTKNYAAEKLLPFPYKSSFQLNYDTIIVVTMKYA